MFIKDRANLPTPSSPGSCVSLSKIAPLYRHQVLLGLVCRYQRSRHSTDTKFSWALCVFIKDRANLPTPSSPGSWVSLSKIAALYKHKVLLALVCRFQKSRHSTETKFSWALCVVIKDRATLTTPSSPGPCVSLSKIAPLYRHQVLLGLVCRYQRSRHSTDTNFSWALCRYQRSRHFTDTKFSWALCLFIKDRATLPTPSSPGSWVSLSKIATLYRHQVLLGLVCRFQNVPPLYRHQVLLGFGCRYQRSRHSIDTKFSWALCVVIKDRATLLTPSSPGLVCRYQRSRHSTDTKFSWALCVVIKRSRHSTDTKFSRALCVVIKDRDTLPTPSSPGPCVSLSKIAPLYRHQVFLALVCRYQRSRHSTNTKRKRRTP